MPEFENSVVDLQKYFEVPAKDFMEFWKSLSDEEKIYYKTADLS